jgi:5'(3')-deoxyribonucleotidase
MSDDGFWKTKKLRINPKAPNNISSQGNMVSNKFLQIRELYILGNRMDFPEISLTWSGIFWFFLRFPFFEFTSVSVIYCNFDKLIKAIALLNSNIIPILTCF